MNCLYKLSRIFLFVSFVALFTSTKSHSQPWMENLSNVENPNYYEIVDSFEKYWQGKDEKKGGYKQFKRWQYFWETRVNSDGTFPNLQEKMREFSDWNIKNTSNQTQAGPTWDLIGPVNIPNLAVQGLNVPQMGTGRINAIAFHPESDNIIYVGAAAGGIWKSTNGGSSWKTYNLTNMVTQGISHIAVATSNPNILYAATGDWNGSNSSASTAYSVGILKSTDAGESWSITNFGNNMQPSAGFLISKIAIHPQNPNQVYAATNGGVYRSNDGGNVWTQITNRETRDMIMHTGNSNYLIVNFINGNYYQYNRSLARINLQTNAIEDEKVYTGTVRIALATTKQNNGNTFYALTANQNSAFRTIEKSTDGGRTWATTVSMSTGGKNWLGWQPDGSGNTGQGFYDLCIAVNPTNSSDITIGGVNAWRSTNNGVAFSLIGEWSGNYGFPYVHADHHTLVYSPGGILYSGHDGGIGYRDPSNGSWKDISSGISANQFYAVSNAVSTDKVIIGGTQDNGSFSWRNSTWTTIFGGDGMDCKVDPSSPSTFYVSTPGGAFFKLTNNGSSASQMFARGLKGNNENGGWVTPLIVDPTNSSRLYAGYNNVWVSDNKGDSWAKLGATGASGNTTIKSIAVAPSNANTLYATYSNRLIKSTNAGSTWTTIYTSNSGNAVTSVAAHPTDPNIAYITLGGYNTGQKVIRINDAAATNISTNLPNLPVNKIVYLKNSNDRLFVGTDAGVYTLDKTSPNWSLYGEGLPGTIVTDIDVHYSSGKMRVATFGRGIWEVPVVDCNIEKPEVIVTGNLQKCPGDTVYFEVNGSFPSIKWSNGAISKKNRSNCSWNYNRYCIRS